MRLKLKLFTFLFVISLLIGAQFQFNVLERIRGFVINSIPDRAADAINNIFQTNQPQKVVIENTPNNEQSTKDQSINNKDSQNINSENKENAQNKED